MIPATPYWLQNRQRIGPELEQNITCDVVVIGGGITGVAVCRGLLKEGIDTVLVEGREIAMSATGRNAGFILQGTAERYNRAIEVYGREKARQIHQYTIDNHKRIQSCIEEEELDCEYRKSGSLQLAGSVQEEEELRESQKLLCEDGFVAELLEDLPLHYKEANFEMGVLLPEDGEIQPAQYVRQSAKRFQQRGLRIFEESPVLKIHDSADSVLCECPKGTISAQMVIVCTNAQIATLCPLLKNKVDPVRGQMLSTSPAPKIFERPIYADHGYDYWRQCPDGRIVLGGWRNLDPETETGCEELLHADIQRNMENFLRRFRALQNITIEKRWSGIMGFSYDGLPLMGALPGYSSTLIAAGFTGHGFGFAQLVGEEVAQIVIEGHSELTKFMGCHRI